MLAVLPVGPLVATLRRCLLLASSAPSHRQPLSIPRIVVIVASPPSSPSSTSPISTTTPIATTSSPISATSSPISTTSSPIATTSSPISSTSPTSPSSTTPSLSISPTTTPASVPPAMAKPATTRSEAVATGPSVVDPSPLPVPRGLSVFQDIFRRADKNDDGKLSFEEFKAYFEDDVLCAEEMADLFQEIDTHHTDNLDIDELCGYFSWHLGRFSDVFSALEDLNTTLLQAMDSTKREYTQASGIQQFVTRFLLRETSNQVNSFQASLLCATDAIHAAQTSNDGLDVDTPSFALSNRISKHGRRLSKTFSSVDNLKFGGVSESQWVGQLNRLQKLTQTLPKALHLEPQVKETDNQEGSHILLVQRQISTLDDKLEGFQEVIQDYTKHTNRHVGCLHITVQKLAGEPKFVIYEFWENSTSWKSHLKSQENTSFQRGTAELLDSPEIISSMMVPTSWWSLNNE